MNINPQYGDELAVRITPSNLNHHLRNPSTPLGAPQGRLSLRTAANNPNHHLWCNNGTWWAHFTVHRPDYTKERIRVSLGTKDVEQARTLRDLFLAGVTDTAGALNA
jgi:hypothetical protein